MNLLQIITAHTNKYYKFIDKNSQNKYKSMQVKQIKWGIKLFMI